MGRCNKCLPKNFLCHYPLKTGAYVVGIFMFCLMLGVTIALLVQALDVRDCEDCGRYPWKQTYGYSVVACIDGFFLTVVNLWLFWGIRKEKTSVVLGWVVVTSFGMVQSTALLVVLLFIFCSEVNAASWVCAVVFAVIGLGIVIYGFLVVYAYWLELKKLKEGPVPVVVVNLSPNNNNSNN